MTELSGNEKSRYHRHLILNQIGEPGQKKIRNSRVLVVGAGGLGCPVIHYLTTTGVGKIGIMDDDQVDLSNLQRQVFYSMNDLGKHKAIVATSRMKRLNPNVEFELLNIRMTYKNALEIADNYDILVDCTDNLIARYVLSDTAILTGKPLVHASVYKFQGQLSVFGFQNGPSYRCLFSTPEPEYMANTSILGIYSILPGIVGLLQANEVIKIITGAGNVMSGKLLIYNALTNQFNNINIKRDENNFIKEDLLKSFGN
jgi:molybdopterin/thiamine biosynthesis adenylyltransferase